jgi:hypothetical protein
MQHVSISSDPVPMGTKTVFVELVLLEKVTGLVNMDVVKIRWVCPGKRGHVSHLFVDVPTVNNCDLFGMNAPEKTSRSAGNASN